MSACHRVQVIAAKQVVYGANCKTPYVTCEFARQGSNFNVPLDILVIDMDWHITDGLATNRGMGWTGYTWNTSLFPEPDKFLKWTKNQQLKTTLNLHPASGIAPDELKYNSFAKAMQFDTTGYKSIPFEVADKKFMGNLFSIILHPLQESGINFWWLDWQQWKDS